MKKEGVIIKTADCYHVDGIEVNGCKFKSRPCYNFFIDTSNDSILLEEEGDNYVFDYSRVMGAKNGRLELMYLGKNISRTGIFNGSGLDVELIGFK